MTAPRVQNLSVFRDVICITSVDYLGFVIFIVVGFLKCMTLGFGCTWGCIWGWTDSGLRRDEGLSYVGTQYS